MQTAAGEPGATIALSAPATCDAKSTIIVRLITEEGPAAGAPQDGEADDAASPISIYNYGFVTELSAEHRQGEPIQSARPDYSNHRFVELLVDRQSFVLHHTNKRPARPAYDYSSALLLAEQEPTVQARPAPLEIYKHHFAAPVAERYAAAPRHGNDSTAAPLAAPAASALPENASASGRQEHMFVAAARSGSPRTQEQAALDPQPRAGAESAQPGMVEANYPAPADEPLIYVETPGPHPAPFGPEAKTFIMPGCPYYPMQSGAHTICGVDCGPPWAPRCAQWHDARPIPWSLFGPGEYVGPPRPEHVPTYYLRVNDLITLTYIASRQRTPERYRIGVGDRLRIESATDAAILREVEVQPDGYISLPLVGDLPAAGKTVKELRDEVVGRYSRLEEEPLITVTPVEVNAAVREILSAVTAVIGAGGQAIDLRVTPEGTIQAPGLGSVYVQGLTLEELRAELEARYAAAFSVGLLVSPALTERATSYAFIGGEVVTPGRYTLEGPTTVMQAITMAGGWNIGANNRQVVVFRRDENWCLKATRIDVHRPLYGKDPCPVNDVWLRDNDLVIVPKSRVLCATDIIELYFTRGVYAVFPVTFVRDLGRGSMITPIP